MTAPLLVVLISSVLVSSLPAPAAPLGQNRGPVTGQLKDSLISLERQSWQAWQQRNGAFFQSFLSDDHVEVGFGGITRKAAVVAGVASPVCVVHSYNIDRFELTRLNPTTALLTYHAAQQTLCGGHPVPSPVWASSIYVRRGNHWLNAMYQQSQAVS
jgi:hypothetical protein